MGLPRQKVNYHLRALEAHGLVRLVEQRKWGGLTERLLVATASSYVVSPAALGPVAVSPDREIDRLSASYLIALGARVVREVSDLSRQATDAGKGLATLGAYARGGLKDLQDAVLNAFPDSMKAREEPGMIASPTPQIITAQLTGKNLDMDMGR